MAPGRYTSLRSGKSTRVPTLTHCGLPSLTHKLMSRSDPREPTRLGPFDGLPAQSPPLNFFGPHGFLPHLDGVVSLLPRLRPRIELVSPEPSSPAPPDSFASPAGSRSTLCVGERTPAGGAGRVPVGPGLRPRTRRAAGLHALRADVETRLLGALR